MSNPIRVATAVLSQRIFAGRPTKDGLGFKEPRYDVTSDVLRAIYDKVGLGNEVTVECDGVPRYRIAILLPRDTDGSPKGTDPQGLDGEAATAGAEGIAQTSPSGPKQ